MRTKPTYLQLDRAVGKRVKVKRHNTAADLRRVLESERTLLQQALASDPGEIARAASRMPAKPLTRKVKKQTPPAAPQRPGSSGDIVPFSGEGRLLDALNLFVGTGAQLPRRGRGQAILERGGAQMERENERARQNIKNRDELTQARWSKVARGLMK